MFSGRQILKNTLLLTAAALLLTETIKYALIVIASFPMLCLYPFMQRFFVKGVMLGAVKG